jgi:hypothetical protein
MMNLVNSFFARSLSITLAVMLLLLSGLAGPAEAMLLPAAPQAARLRPERANDLARVQTVLESKVVQQRLLDYGLTPEETAARINALSDEQVHQLAAHMDAVQAGGDIVGAILALAIIGALIVLIIYILQGRIAIERT